MEVAAKQRPSVVAVTKVANPKPEVGTKRDQGVTRPKVTTCVQPKVGPNKGPSSRHQVSIGLKIRCCSKSPSV